MVRTRAVQLMAVAAGASALVLAAGGPVASQPADPPGNNGTVKVDGVEFDQHPNNQPHVGCVFQVDSYGFDEGDLEATVLFEAHPPTVGDDVEPPGRGQELLTAEVPIGEDAAGGGTDLDAERTYDLGEALAGIAPHPVQGWHVKLTVHAEGSQGADTKFKVFWVEGCKPTTSTSSPGTTSPSTTSPSSTTTKPGETTTTRPGETTSTAPGGKVGPSAPGGTSPSGPGAGAAVGAEGALPRTGANLLPLAGGALALIAGGVTGLLWSRRLRPTGDH